jgi:hypothetical protein
MKKLLIILSLVFISCSKDEIPQQEQQSTVTCYRIMNVVNTPTYDYIVVEIYPYEYETYQVSDYRDYLRRTQICDLSTLKKL